MITKKKIGIINKMVSFLMRKANPNEVEEKSKNLFLFNLKNFLKNK